MVWEGGWGVVYTFLCTFEARAQRRVSSHCLIPLRQSLFSMTKKFHFFFPRLPASEPQRSSVFLSELGLQACAVKPGLLHSC